MPHEVFISYRKIISETQAKILETKINEVFGAGTAFLDTSALETGGEWAVQLKNKLDQAKVVLVVIGKDWTTCCFDYTDMAVGIQEGQRRIDHPEDWVCLEIEEGYKAQKAFPIYMGGAKVGSVNPSAMPVTKPNLQAFFKDIQSDIVISNGHKSHEFEPVFTALEKKGLQRLSLKTTASPPPLVFDKTAVMTEYHCYCCNRDQHYDDLLTFFNDNGAQQPHLHFFFPSLDTDKPESFITRFLLDPYGVNNNYVANRRHRDERSNKITQQDLRPSICQKMIEGEIKRQLEQVVVPNTDLWEVFLFRINLRDWSEKNIHTLLNYLSSTPFQNDFGKHKLLLFFWLNTLGMQETSSKRFFGFFGKKSPDKLQIFQNQLSPKKQMIYLKELTPVDKIDVQNWFSNHSRNTQSYLGLINNQLFSGVEQLRMGDIEPFLLKLIQSK